MREYNGAAMANPVPMVGDSEVEIVKRENLIGGDPAERVERPDRAGPGHSG